MIMLNYMMHVKDGTKRLQNEPHTEEVLKGKHMSRKFGSSSRRTTLGEFQHI
jgi:hypothetical protein